MRGDVVENQRRRTGFLRYQAKTRLAALQIRIAFFLAPRFATEFVLALFIGESDMRIDDDDSCHQFGMSMRGKNGAATAKAVADDRHRSAVVVANQADNFRNEIRERIFRAVAAVSHPAQIHRDYAIVLGERGRHEIPPMRVPHKSVNQQQGVRIFPRTRPFKIVNRIAGNIDIARNAGTRETPGEIGVGGSWVVQVATLQIDEMRL